MLGGSRIANAQPIDFDTVGENGPENEGTVTLRERDSMEQTRIKIEELPGHLLGRIR